jgi:hypothetical protein
VFGETEDIYTANIPIPYEPSNHKKVLPLDSLALRWTGQGYYDLFQLQVFSDSLLSDSVIDTTMNSSFFILENLINHSIYFWRVRSILNSEVSDWSPIWSFEVTDAFITMATPNGGEVWSMGTEEVIRWETNITDSVRLDLLYGGQNVLTIDTTFGDPNAYRWLIPTSLTPDTSYKIIVKSIKDSTIIDTSNAVFSLIPPSGIEAENLEIAHDYHLFQNYPNPFNPSTIIKFQLPVRSKVTLKIYDALSNEVAILLNEEKESGSYNVEFNAMNYASGIYFYRLKAGKFIQTKKMILMK